MLQALLKPWLVSSITIISDAPRRSIIYDRKTIIVQASDDVVVRSNVYIKLQALHYKVGGQSYKTFCDIH